MSNSDKMREVKLTVRVQTLTTSRNKLLLICITVHVCFLVLLSEYASPHIRLQA